MSRNGTEVQNSIPQLRPLLRDESPHPLATTNFMPSILRNIFKEYKSPEGPITTRLVDNLHPSDPRSKSSEFNKAKSEELKELIHRETWKKVPNEIIPKNENIYAAGFYFRSKILRRTIPLTKQG